MLSHLLHSFEGNLSSNLAFPLFSFDYDLVEHHGRQKNLVPPTTSFQPS